MININNDLSIFIEHAREATSFQDIYFKFENLINTYDEYSELQLILALPREKTNIHIKGYNLTSISSGKEITFSFFSSKRLYCFDAFIISKMNSLGSIVNPIDISMSFDTNFASYIDKFINNRQPTNQSERNHEIINCITQILENNIQFDYFPYLIEQTKEFFNWDNYSLNYKLSWNNANPHIKNNLISLELFKSINYPKTKNYQPTISLDDATKSASKTFESYYCSMTINHNRKVHLLCSIMIYKIIEIQYEMSSFGEKLEKFLLFMFDTLGSYMQVFTIVALHYFKDPNLAFFNKISLQTKEHKIKKLIDSMSWDLVIFLSIEHDHKNMSNQEFYLPYFLTYDQSFFNLLKILPLKGILYDKKTETSIPLRDFYEGDIINELSKYSEQLIDYFNLKESNKRRKNSTKELSELETIFSKLKPKVLNMFPI